MTTKERLHKLVDELSEQEADATLELIASRSKSGAIGSDEPEDPLLRAIANAPEDDEPWTDEDEAAVQESRDEIAAGIPLIPFEEIKRKYGLA